MISKPTVKQQLDRFHQLLASSPKSDSSMLAEMPDLQFRVAFDWEQPSLSWLTPEHIALRAEASVALDGRLVGLAVYRLDGDEVESGTLYHPGSDTWERIAQKIDAMLRSPDSDWPGSRNATSQG